MAEWRDTPHSRAVRDGASGAGLLALDVQLVEAVLDGLKAADLLAAPRGQQLRGFHVEPCRYVSKACEHKLHDADEPGGDFCRLTCKFCGSRCECPDPDCRHGRGRTEPVRLDGPEEIRTRMVAWVVDQLIAAANACAECGVPHSPRESRPGFAPSWADPVDGHPYRTAQGRQVTAWLLACKVEMLAATSSAPFDPGHHGAETT